MMIHLVALVLYGSHRWCLIHVDTEGLAESVPTLHIHDYSICFQDIIPIYRHLSSIIDNCLAAMANGDLLTMRPPTKPQSALRAPLNEILGTEANVRILRVLASTKVPMSKAAIARRAMLDASGVGRSIDELTERGIVESLGTGSRRLYRLRREQPLASTLTELFAAELARFESIVDGIRSAVHLLKPPPRAAWIQGPVAANSDEPDDPVIVGILASARSIDQTVEQLRTGVTDLEGAYDVTISVHGLTSADFIALAEAERAEVEETLPLLGPPPLELLCEGHSNPVERRIDSHEELDRRAVVFARAIAAKLSEDPSLIERAQKYIARRLQQASARERKEHEEWDRILRTMSLPRLKRFLVEPSERATRLRQSLPFVGALSKKELEFLKETQR